MLTGISGPKPIRAPPTPSIGVPVCVHCRTTFADETLSLHYLSSKSHPKCKRCCIGFPDLASYNAHMIHRHRAIACRKCASAFHTVDLLQKHYESFPSHSPDFVHSPVAEPRTPKPVVSQPPKAKQPLAQQSEQYHCSICNLVFKRRQLLEKHNIQKIHWRCATCSTTFVTDKVYQKHLRKKHNDSVASHPPQSGNNPSASTQSEATPSQPADGLDESSSTTSGSESEADLPTVPTRRQLAEAQQLKDWDDTSTSSQADSDSPLHGEAHNSPTQFFDVTFRADISRDWRADRGDTRPAPIRSRNAWDESSSSADSERDGGTPDLSTKGSMGASETVEPSGDWDGGSISSESESEEEKWCPRADGSEKRETTTPMVVRKAMSESNVDFLKADADDRISKSSHPTRPPQLAACTPPPLPSDSGEREDVNACNVYRSVGEEHIEHENDYDQGSHTDEEGTPRSYEHYRCPVCDESYYTLEVLSAHMAANGHGRFGTVEFIRDQRIEAASAYLGCQSVDFTDCMDDAPQYGVPVTPVLERPVRETEYRAEAAPHTFVPERLPAIAAMQPAAQAAMSRTSDAPYRFSPPTTSSQPASSVPPTPYLLQLCQCVPCGIMFGSPDELDTHYRVSTAHPSCPLCGNGQEHQDALFQHCRIVHRMDVCECGEIVASGNLPAHYSSSPSHSRCQRRGGGFKNWIEHEQRTHNQLGAFCVNCQEWYGPRTALMEHMATCFRRQPAPPPPPQLAHIPNRRYDNVEEYLQVGEPEREAWNPEVQPAAASLWEQNHSVTPKAPHLDSPNDHPPREKSPLRLAPLVVDTNLLPEITQGWNPALPSSSLCYPPIPAECERRAATTAIVPETTAQQADLPRGEAYQDAPIEYCESAEISKHKFSATEGGFQVILNDNTNAGLRSGTGSGARQFVFMTESDVHTETTPTAPPSPPVTKHHPPHHDRKSLDTPTTESSSAPSGFQQYHQFTTYSGPKGTSVSSGSTARSTETRSIYDKMAASMPSWHCQSCGRNPCDDPTAASCGHIFCFGCIAREIVQNMKCPVCNHLFLLKLRPSAAS